MAHFRKDRQAFSFTMKFLTSGMHYLLLLPLVMPPSSFPWHHGIDQTSASFLCKLNTRHFVSPLAELLESIKEVESLGKSYAPVSSAARSWAAGRVARAETCLAKGLLATFLLNRLVLCWRVLAQGVLPM